MTLKLPVFKDRGYGVSTISTRFLSRSIDKIGIVKKLETWSSFCTEYQADRKSAVRDHNTIVTGTQGRILLSGFNCGYGEEGPRGLFIALTRMQWKGLLPVSMLDIAGTHHLIVTRKSVTQKGCSDTQKRFNWTGSFTDEQVKEVET